MADSTPSPVPSGKNPRAVSLRLVLLFVTCCAVVLGLVWHWPGVLPILGVALVVAVVRTWTMLRAGGTPAGLTAWKTWGLSLLGSLLAVTLVGSTSAAAFMAVCLPLAASQLNIADGPSRLWLLKDAAWLLGGAAAAALATLSLDVLWLQPVAQTGKQGTLRTARQRVRYFFNAVTPLLSALVVGGLCSFVPVALAVASGLNSGRLGFVTLFITSVMALLAGAWVGFHGAKRSEFGMAALLGGIVGLLPLTAALLVLQLLWNGMAANIAALTPRLDSPWVWAGGCLAAVVTVLAWRWSRRAD